MTPSKADMIATLAEKMAADLTRFAALVRSTAGDQPELFPEPPKKKFDPKGVPLPFAEPEFRAAWNEFCDVRAEGRKKVTPRAAAMQLKSLAEFPVWVATKALFDAAKNNWTGTFPEKVNASTAQSFAQQDYDRLLRNMAESAARNADV